MACYSVWHMHFIIAEKSNSLIKTNTKNRSMHFIIRKYFMNFLHVPLLYWVDHKHECEKNVTYSWWCLYCVETSNAFHSVCDFQTLIHFSGFPPDLNFCFCIIAKLQQDEKSLRYNWHAVTLVSKLKTIIVEKNAHWSKAQVFF